MSSVKISLGKKYKKEFVIPTFDGTMEHIKGESIMTFGWEEYNGRKYRQFFAIGKVMRVVKGEKSDLIYMDFGMPMLKYKHQNRLIIAYNNHARRQTLTLKRGQVAMVYGISRFYKTTKVVKGVKKTYHDILLYALGFQGWYVPTMIDIKHLPKNEDILVANDEEKKIEEQALDILDLFEKGGELTDLDYEKE